MTMTFEEFMETVLSTFPSAQAEQDNDGQLLIYTNLTEDKNGQIVPMSDSE